MREQFPVVIVEGPDGSGKTTLINQLGRTPVKYRALRSGVGATREGGASSDDAATPGWANPTLSALDAYSEALRTAKPGTALDRFHLSEVVYGPLLRGQSGIDTADVEELTARLLEQRVPIILCLPDLNTTIQNVEAPGRERPMFQTLEFLVVAHDRWTKLARGLMCRAHVAGCVYDYTKSGGSPEEVLRYSWSASPAAHAD